MVSDRSTVLLVSVESVIVDVGIFCFPMLAFMLVTILSFGTVQGIVAYLLAVMCAHELSTAS